MLLLFFLKFDFSLKLCYYIYNEMKGEMIYGIKES